ncbi:MAG TPA: ABC transporter permease, partial [Bacteroidota bacterium]|nr:ABC transporter permease [Bacteroidota bacterium]
ALGTDSARSFLTSIERSVKRYFPQAQFNLDSVLTVASSSTALQSDTLNGRTDSMAIGAGNFFSRMIDFQSVQLVGKDIANPNATRSVGGWAMMFLLFTLSNVANALIDERRNAVFMRILAAPFSRMHILTSRYLYGTLLGTVQLIVLFIAGALLFNIDITSNAGNLFLVILLSAAAATGFGMLIASFARTTAQAGAIGMMLILSMSTVGGAWFPTSLMPASIQALGKLSLVYWSIEGFLIVLWRGAGFVEILPVLGMLCVFAVVTIAISLVKFSRTQVL